MVPVSIGMLNVLVGLWGCDTQPDTSLISKQALVMQQVDATPVMASELCQQIDNAEQRTFCLLYGLELLPMNNVDAIQDICKQLDDPEKSECWFELAQTTMSPTFCAHAVLFETECRSTLLFAELKDNPIGEWTNLAVRAQYWGVDLTNPIQLKLLHHYYFRNEKKIILKKCDALSDPESCVRYLQGLYTERVKDWGQLPNASCNSIPEEIHHGGQPVLQDIFENASQLRCH